MLDQITTITEVSARHWQPFHVISPGGIPYAGYICRHESDKLGLLAITELAGQARLEFVYAMPKIHYPYHQDREGRLQVIIPIAQNVQEARFTRKLDGTAIIFYPLTDTKGNILEVIPRTRLQPILAASKWGDWHTLLNEVLPDRTLVEKAVCEQKVVLVFELWGYRNPHLIKYNKPLTLTLHTAVRHKKVVSFRLLSDFAHRYGFDLIPTLEVAKPDSDGLAQAYKQWQEKLETQNRAAGEGVYVEEGAILVLSTAETATYWKCKPPTIEEIHWTADPHISKETVQQTLYKMRENGYEFENGRVEDVHEMLAADFEQPLIEGATDLIQQVYQAYTLELQKQAWLRHLVESSGLPLTDLPNLMRHLSQHYPKNEMKWVYATVRELFG